MTVRLEQVTVTYPTPQGGVDACRDVDLTTEPGKVVALVGPSGSGKTTVLSVLALLQRPTSGHVWFGGRDLARTSERERGRVGRQEVGMVFQRGVLVEHLTAVENVALPLLADRRRTARSTATRLLADMGLAEHQDKLPGALSGGEAQRVAVCRAVVRRPSLVVADEPTSSLDEDSAGHVRAALRGLAEAGASVVVATHDAATWAWADEVVRMDAGEGAP
ncbi:ABC transporter ATP-binding protein [Cellulomonas fimi]|uniref:ABC transporter related protein n=1 Tax=Cellulomonas fimi (strain ATCC 484 / DSM 20113 / JCM 1341 / CCUG 24087 / LMG 16345 / NBRC 15513 / NCIMB 8980 / NCTC 7547 / NRS-133) TaxID=590998 RepID=F4H4P3_CELFA|nr:ABC transporter ATP-binding protein [Cellulomonas fimi]AEE44244.1 ABC transporter related protein [Cellulomonas fimi ATCC 484]NNH05691.1 ABC transporter ATP-binding protein [Cellulomonas fimi]VEH25958.1 Lipoprotein-releasing system ATP-binding protein LolD [Cellulomonas fimi]